MRWLARVFIIVLNFLDLSYFLEFLGEFVVGIGSISS